MRPGEQILFTVLVFILTGLLFYGLALVLVSFGYGLSFAEVNGIMSNPGEGDRGVLKLMQIVTGTGNYIVAALLISWFLTGSWTGFFRTGAKPGIYSLLLSALLIIAGLPLINFITEFNLQLNFPSEKVQLAMEQMEKQAEGLTWILTGADNAWGLAVNILMIALIPGLGEELIFRGLIQRMFTRWFRNGHLAILLTAFIFSALHLQFLSFLSRFVLGIILGYLFYYGRSIWYPVAAHTFNNLLGVVFYYNAHRETASGNWDEIGTSQLMPWSALISLFSLLVIFYLWYRSVKEISPGLQDASLQKD